MFMLISRRTSHVPGTAWVTAGTLLLAHLVTLGRYGVFRDELYYVANGRRLAWGYVDHPPLVAAIAWGTEHTLGASVPALRLPMLLALAGLLAAVASLVTRMGGGGAAIALAWLALALSPYYLFAFHYLSMNGPEALWWTLAALLLAHVLGLPNTSPHARPATSTRDAWLALGAVMGLALLTKVSGVIWGAALAAAVVVSPARRELFRPWPWAAAVVAVLLFLPHVAWQVQHGWPTAEFVRNAQAAKIAAFSPAEFLGEQVKLLGPVATAVAIAGLAAAVSGRVAGGRMWAGMYLVTASVFLTQPSKPYYLMPAYPMLLAAGAVGLERWAPWRRGSGRLVLLVLVACGMLLVPIGLPVLPVHVLPGYLRALGIEVASGERHDLGALPQHYADMFGWDTLADDVARVVAALPAAERARTRIYTQNYGQAGALEYFGPERGLPPVISGHNAYWHWGPGPDLPDGVLIIVGGDAEDHRRAFTDVRQAARTTCTLCMPYERELPIFVARGPRRPMSEIWPSTRHYD